MDENRFWQLIDDAWQATNGLSADERCSRQLAGSLSPEDERNQYQEQERMIAALTERLEQMSPEDLLAFDRILEQKLYTLDREEIHEHTDGSDDGFLYARGFIVALGETYYTLVDTDPSKAEYDCECEEMCYLSFHVYRKKFGEMPRSGISRESGSNKQGWPST